MAFSGDRLRILRRFHNLTQRDLGAAIGSAASAITNYERGRAIPKTDALSALAAYLKVNEAFFFLDGVDDEFEDHETNFRSLAATPERTRNLVLAHATMFGALVRYLTRIVQLPELRLPRIKVSTFAEIERAAELCRVEWGVGVDAPIENITRMMEHAGIIVTLLWNDIGNQVDAFSRYGPTNLIVLNPAKRSAARARMDVAHEAAHAVLHGDGLPADLAVREDQANYFAGALLMPQRSFGREFWALGQSRSWEDLLTLKARWGASVPAIIVRAFHLGLIDAAEYRRRYKYMSKAGWLRGAEPGEVDAERPELFRMALERFQEATGESTSQIAAALGWSRGLFQQVTGIDPTDIARDSSGETFDVPTRPTLMVI